MNAYAGIYVHIPFCLRKCPYCDFYSKTDLSLIAPYIEALSEEIRLRSNHTQTVDSIYFGGGTPSVLAPEQISRILNDITRHFSISTDTEVTLELNPGTAAYEQISAYKSMGVNRLNIGIQSFSNRRLRELGRIHDAQTAIRVIHDARDAGYENIGIDLIYGLPGQSESQWQDDMNRAVSFRPEHLSCYMLTIEKDTPMEKDVIDGRIEVLAEASVSALFRFTIKFLKQHGYAQYEISNFAREDFGGARDYQSRHNKKYWNFIPYWGFGPGAHSFIGAERMWNHRSLTRYLGDINHQKLPISGRERLSREQQITETIYLGLRQNRGVDISAFERRFSVSFYRLFGAILGQLESEGLSEVKKGRFALTLNGQLLLDAICGLFMDQLEAEP